MKAKLEFKLPEEKLEFYLASHAHDLWEVLWDLDQHLRSQLKHGDITEETYEALDSVRSLLWDSCYSQIQEYVY